ncbi:uncharacterized protein [Maniola hyperantus]|uniref:uncharacterized protein n=1 Tax=Aphantopus hyperantus TaxID=2795564 RepID=UPI003749FC0E
MAKLNFLKSLKIKHEPLGTLTCGTRSWCHEPLCTQLASCVHQCHILTSANSNPLEHLAEISLNLGRRCTAYWGSTAYYELRNPCDDLHVLFLITKIPNVTKYNRRLAEKKMLADTKTDQSVNQASATTTSKKPRCSFCRTSGHDVDQCRKLKRSTGPIFWNILLDGLLEETTGLGAPVQAYADDILIISTGKDGESIEGCTAPHRVTVRHLYIFDEGLQRGRDFEDTQLRELHIVRLRSVTASRPTEDIEVPQEAELCGPYALPEQVSPHTPHAPATQPRRPQKIHKTYTPRLPQAFILFIRRCPRAEAEAEASGRPILFIRRCPRAEAEAEASGRPILFIRRCPRAEAEAEASGRPINMPFKVVQTTERGKICISAVPSGWERNGVLSWPPNSQLGMIRDEKSKPKSTWKHLPCIVKRHFSTYEEASNEANKMESETDTDQEESRNTIQESCVFDDFNSMILVAQENHQAEFPSPTNTTGIQVDKENVLPKLDELTPPGTSMIADVQVQEQQTLLWLNPPEKNNFQETVLKRLETIENGQMNIMMKLSELGAQIEGFLHQTQQEKLSTVVGFEPIDSVEDLEQFNELLKDKESSDKLKEKLAVVCGTGKGKGTNNCFSLVDVMFTRRFLTECSWAGGSRNDKKKTCFKAYNRVISFFFDLIYNSDKKFTVLECETFFKNILKNSVRRNSSKLLRTSATKARGKGKGTGKKSNTQNNDCATTSTSHEPSLEKLMESNQNPPNPKS